MKMIVGLGNPGRKYEGTPHNLGFEVADELARRAGISFQDSPRYHAFLAEGRLAGMPLMIVKPMTFMNLSGSAVAPLARQRELGEDGLLAITDDVAIGIGQIRLRPFGSAGGHNGLKSLIEHLATDRFPRLRVGIKPDWPVESLTDFVLRRPPPLERARLEEMVTVAADAAELWLAEGCNAAAERYNGARRFPPAGS